MNVTKLLIANKNGFASYEYSWMNKNGLQLSLNSEAFYHA